MTGATGQLLSVKSRLKRNLVQRDQERKVQNGNVQMTNSTTLSGKPSLPATRYRLFKVFAAKGSRPKLFAGLIARRCPWASNRKSRLSHETS
jgi:hypothetical protein